MPTATLVHARSKLNLPLLSTPAEIARAAVIHAADVLQAACEMQPELRLTIDLPPDLMRGLEAINTEDRRHG